MAFAGCCPDMQSHVDDTLLLLYEAMYTHFPITSFLDTGRVLFIPSIASSAQDVAVTWPALIRISGHGLLT